MNEVVVVVAVALTMPQETTMMETEELAVEAVSSYRIHRIGRLSSGASIVCVCLYVNDDALNL